MDNSDRRRKMMWLLCYTAAMLVTSLLPMDHPETPHRFWARMDPSLQNMLHIPMFMGFVFFLDQWLKSFRITPRHRLALAICVSSFLGVLIEAIQMVVPGRYPSVNDIVLNLIGVVVCVSILNAPFFMKKRGERAE